MKLEWLLQACGEVPMKKRLLAQEQTRLDAVFFLPVQEPEEHILYIGTAEELDGMSSGRRCTFWLVEEARNSDLEASFPNADFIYSTALKKEELLRLVQERLLQEREFYLREHDILRNLLAEQDIQKVVDTAYSVLKNPIMIIEPTRNRLAAAWGGKPPEPGSCFERLQRGEPVLDAPDVVANINSLRRAAEKLAKTGKPVSFYHEQLGMEVMVTGVRVDSVELMRITLFAHEHPFDELDYAFAADLGALLGRLFGDSGFYRQNRGRTISYFLKELFSESRPNLTNLLERLQRCGYRLRDQFLVMSVWPDPSSPPEPAKLEALAEQLSHYLVGHMYAVMENHVVLLLNYEAGKDLDESALRSIRHILHANHAHAGISNLFQDLLDAKQYAWQAEEALSVWLNGQSGVEDEVTFFSEVAYRSIFEICRQQVSLMDFCDPALLELMRIDQRDGSHLTVTLYQYLQHGCNAPRTAQLLFIHKNTMLYRLEKIRAILGADLTDGDVLFRLQLSYRILIYFGYFNEKS